MNLQSQCRGDKTGWLVITTRGWWGSIPVVARMPWVGWPFR